MIVIFHKFGGSKCTLRERSHMTSAAEGGGGFEMLTVADKGGSKPITVRETTALIYSPKLMTTFSFKLDKINI